MRRPHGDVSGEVEQASWDVLLGSRAFEVHLSPRQADDEGNGARDADTKEEGERVAQSRLELAVDNLPVLRAVIEASKRAAEFARFVLEMVGSGFLHQVFDFFFQIFVFFAFVISRGDIRHHFPAIVLLSWNHLMMEKK